MGYVHHKYYTVPDRHLVARPNASQRGGGSRYFFSLVDDYSSNSAIYFLKHKSDAFECFKHYQNYYERQTRKKIKRSRLHNGKEFCANYFEMHLKNQGVKIERKSVFPQK